MEAISTALLAGLTTTALFGIIASLSGLLIVAVLVAFGMNRLSRTVGGMSRGKAKV